MSSNLFKNVTYKLLIYKSFNICMYKQDLTLTYKD